MTEEQNPESAAMAAAPRLTDVIDDLATDISSLKADLDKLEDVVSAQYMKLTESILALSVRVRRLEA